MERIKISKSGSTNPNKLQEIGNAQRRRLERIDLLLAWDASFGRSDLTDFFGISDQQASADIAKYKEIAPLNCQYDTQVRKYRVTENYQYALVRPSADRFLDQLQGLKSQMLEPSQTWFREIPNYDIIPSFRPDVLNETLRGLLKAIRENSAIKIKYQSLTGPEPTVRWIAPHAIAFSGRRWHVRAWCFKRDEFRDFVLTRVLSVLEFDDLDLTKLRGSTIQGEDLDWNTTIEVKIVPCSALPDSQRKVIAKDYGMDIRGRRIGVRKCLIVYFVDWHRLDPNRYGNIPENERMIEIDNWDEVSRHMPKDR